MCSKFHLHDLKTVEEIWDTTCNQQLDSSNLISLLGGLMTNIKDFNGEKNSQKKDVCTYSIS